VSHKSPRTQEIGSNDPSYRYALADIPVLLKTIDSLKQTIAGQQQTITALQTEIVQLKARLAELEARLNQNSTNSNRPPSSDGSRRPQTPRKNVGKPREVSPATRGALSNKSLTQTRLQFIVLPPVLDVAQPWHQKKPHRSNGGRSMTFLHQKDHCYRALMVYLSIYQLLPYDRVRELFSDLFNCCPSRGTIGQCKSAECSRGLVGVEEQVRNPPQRRGGSRM